MKTIAIFTDSLGLPRPEVPLTDSWPSLLARRTAGRAIVHTFGFGGATTRQLLRKLSTGYLSNINTDVVIYQVGIVDCAPRALRRYELILCKTPGISHIIQPLIKRHYSTITRKRNITYTSKEEYKSNLEALLNLFPSSKKLLVPILPASTGYAKKSPLINERICDYNHIGSSVFPSSDTIKLNWDDGTLDAMFLPDHHHLSQQGARALALDVDAHLRNSVAI